MNLNPLARELLESLRGQPAARHIILGGGVALSHYHEFRETSDVDAWWEPATRDEEAGETIALVAAAMAALAAKHELQLLDRAWRDTRSLELRRGSRKIFSFQISRRSVQLDAPSSAEWEPVRIETFSDNVGAKMNALVDRGAPRDFIDIFTLCRNGLVRVEECWSLWRAKNPGRDVRAARAGTMHALSEIAARRPLEMIHDSAERRRAHEVREFVRLELCATPSQEP